MVPQRTSWQLSDCVEYFAITVRPQPNEGLDYQFNLLRRRTATDDIPGEAEIPVATDREHKTQPAGQTIRADAERRKRNEFLLPHNPILLMFLLSVSRSARPPRLCPCYDARDHGCLALDV